MQTESRVIMKLHTFSINLDNEVVKKMSENIYIAIEAINLETKKAKVVFIAFQQMLNTQVVQIEDIIQLINQMPHITGLVRQALIEMGYEDVKIRDTISTGTVGSTEFVQILTSLMRQQVVNMGLTHVKRYYEGLR